MTIMIKTGFHKCPAAQRKSDIVWVDFLTFYASDLADVLAPKIGARSAQTSVLYGFESVAG